MTQLIIIAALFLADTARAISKTRRTEARDRNRRIRNMNK